MSKVVKLIFVVDDETAGRLEELTAMSVKEREAADVSFLMDLSQTGHSDELHFVHAEVV